ncbi:hypothetical protein HYR53_04240 [Candidatus Acetothermia bacterium]|nr:hypothetical protein [Candidatus Acetothermia bacterium]
MSNRHSLLGLFSVIILLIIGAWLAPKPSVRLGLDSGCLSVSQASIVDAADHYIPILSLAEQTPAEEAGSCKLIDTSRSGAGG